MLEGGDLKLFDSSFKELTRGIKCSSQWPIAVCRDKIVDGWYMLTWSTMNLPTMMVSYEPSSHLRGE